jgi:hypothetical protein
VYWCGLHGAVLTVDLGDDGAVGDVERRVDQLREQARGAVTDVVVGAPLGHARHPRQCQRGQHRLGAVQGLHPGFLVHAQHDRPFGWVVIKPDHVDDLDDELGDRWRA